MNRLTYQQRIAHCQQPIAKQLLTCMSQKQSNLCVSADVTTSKALIDLAERIAPYICLLKTHIDIIEDFTPGLTKVLRALADEAGFLLFEDRKFADIGHTVKSQLTGGIYRIADWADMVNAHSLPGPGILQGLNEAKSLILLAEMSSAGHLLDQHYQQKTLQMAENYRNKVIGFVTQRALNNDPSWINFTPGISLNAQQDTLGQQYKTPQQALVQGADVLIVGRSILSANNVIAECQRYQQTSWQAYQSLFT